MDRSLLAKRYALALYEFAVEKKQTRNALREMKILSVSWREVPELRKALESPVIDLSKKIQLLRKGSGIEKEDVVTRFFDLVARHNRLSLLGRIARAYVELWNEKNGIVRADLITVGKVGKSLSEQLEGLVQKAVGEKKVEFNRLYNPDLIGGFVLQVEDLRIDASVKRELEYIKMNLL